MPRPNTPAEAIREVVANLYRADGTLDFEPVHDLIDFLWPDIDLYSFQELSIEKKLTHPEFFEEVSRGGGKSWGNGLVAIVKKLIWPGRKIIYSGPSYRQSKHPFRYERELIELSPYLQDVVRSKSGERIGVENNERSEIAFTNGSSSVALPASGPKIHGERGSDFVITEAFEYPKELLQRTVKPMRYGAKRYPGMPKTTIYETTAGWQHQFMYEIRQKIIQGMEAGDPRYYFLSIDSDDLYRFGYLKEDDKESLEEDRLTDEDTFQQQHKNVWLSTAGSFYDLSLLTRVGLRRAEVEFRATPGYMFVAGLDVAWSDNPNAADSSFAVWKIRLIGGIPDLTAPPELVYVQIWHSPGTTKQTIDVSELLKRFDISLLVVDAQGAGVDVVIGLKRDDYYEVNDENALGRRIILRYPHTSPIINEDHNSFKAASINGAINFPQQPEPDAENYDSARRVYDLVSVGLKQFADLLTRPLQSGWLAFDPPAGKKRDIAMSILYGWHGVRLKTATQEKPRKQTGVGIVGLGDEE